MRFRLSGVSFVYFLLLVAAWVPAGVRPQSQLQLAMAGEVQCDRPAIPAMEEQEEQNYRGRVPAAVEQAQRPQSRQMSSKSSIESYSKELQSISVEFGL